MNLSTKRIELIKIIFKYLDNKCDLETLQDFSWEIIEYFNRTNKLELPPYQEFEKEFWYTIWQIQHLADNEHESEGFTKKILAEALEYLQKKKKIPDNFVGIRP
jgi:hypothetical protein